MGNIFFATLGQRPEAITVAYDLLAERLEFDEAVIIMTEPNLSGIGNAFNSLREVMRRDYPQLRVTWEILRDDHGNPLIDIVDSSTANAYYFGIYDVLNRYYRTQRHALHMLVAGGRKAMSIYATLAAGLVFGSQDRLWTVLSPGEIMKPGLFHIPAGMRDQVQLVMLPLPPAHILPGSFSREMLEDPLGSYRARANTRERFLRSLTKSERRLVELLLQHPYSTYAELGAIAGIAGKTAENQFHSVFEKMGIFYDHVDKVRNKRQALIDLLTRD